MSKKKNNKKKTNKALVNKKQKKRLTLFNKIIIAVVVILIIGVSVTFLSVYSYLDGKLSQIQGTSWASYSATDEDGNDVELTEVYENASYYDYTGSLTFADDNTFEFWMSVGNPEDGTHKGDYKYDYKNSVVNATFDNGDEMAIKVYCDETTGESVSLEVPYNGYTVIFIKK